MSAKTSQQNAVIRAKERYDSKSVEATQLQQASRHGLPSKESEKLRLKSEKASMQAKQADSEYLTAVDRLAEIHRVWKTDMSVACSDYQKLEEDRFHFLRGNLWNYANFISGGCVLDDEACERIRLALEKCDFDSDLNLFLKNNATGSIIPDSLTYIPYGDVKNQLGVSHDTLYSDYSRNSTGAIVQDLAIGESRKYVPSTTPYEAPSMDLESSFHYDPYHVSENVPIICTVRVLYDYQSQADEELSISKGQIIPVIATHEDG